MTTRDLSLTTGTKMADDMNIGETSVLVCKSSFVWIINDYSIHSKERGTLLKSPIFPSDCDDKNKWFIIINCYDNCSNVLLKPCLVSNQPNQVRAIGFKCQIPAGVAGKPHVVSFFQSLSSDNGCDPKQLISKDFLMKPENGLLPEDRLKLICEVAAFGEPFTKMAEIIRVPKCRMREKMGQLLDTEELSDVILVASGCELRAHKTILAVESAVFSAMFKRDMIENKENRVVIDDVDLSVLKEMLRFVYTGKTTKLDEMSHELLAAANKYDLARLKATCEVAICKNITIDDCAASLVLADLHNSEILKKRTINFINSHLADVKKTSGFQSIAKSRPDLIIEAYDELAKRFNGNADS